MSDSLVFPPATVVEDDDSLEELPDLPEDEYQNMQTRARELSPRVERVVNSFNDELENVTKSIDELICSAQKQSMNQSFESLPYSRSYYSYYSTAKKPSSRDKDPPPSIERVSPLRNYINSTPAARRPATSSSSYSPSTEPPPPVPVATPFPHTYPNPTRQRTVDSRTQYNREPSNTAPPTDAQFSQMVSKDWEETLEKMRQIMNEQEKKIKDLERENDFLRKQLKGQQYYDVRDEPPPVERVHHRHDDFLAAFEPRPSTSERFYREEPVGRLPASSSSTYRTTPMSSPTRNRRSPPKQIHTLTDFIPEEGFTPGTRFVAQLATLMKMENGHHAPLSVILDKHWDKLKHHFMNDDDL